MKTAKKTQVRKAAARQTVVKKELVITRTEAIANTLYMAFASPFMPRYFTHEKSGKSFYPKAWRWQRLQGILTTWEGLRDYRPTELFYSAMNLVNTITNKVAIQDVPNQGDKYEENAMSIAYLCIQRDPAATILLKEMIEKIKASGDMGYMDRDIDDMLVSVELMLQCQEIWHRCQEEPEPEEEKEAQE